MEKMLQSHVYGYGEDASLSKLTAFPSSMTDPPHMLDEAKLLFYAPNIFGSEENT